LCDRALIRRSKQILFPQSDSSKMNADDKALSDKFISFTEAVPDLLRANGFAVGSVGDLTAKHPRANSVICSTKTTRNAKVLSDFICAFRRFDPARHSIASEDVEVICGNREDKLLIVAYNPLQTVVLSEKEIKDVSHPIHLYRAAFDEKLYPAFDDKLCCEWMRSDIKKKANIIDEIATLLRYNKKYEIILVPSSIHLDGANFLSSRCQMVAPEHEAIADHRITFLYRGLLYRYDKKKAKEFLRKKQQKFYQNDEDDFDDDDDKIFVDEIKFLLRLLNDNICNQLPDSMDSFDVDRGLLFDCGDENKKIVQALSEKERIGGINLRASIRRKPSERIFRWLNVGCGSCFLHENSGRATEIGASDGAFADALAQAMFEYYIDCRVPFNEEAVINSDNQCPICYNLIVHPANIGNAECKHVFCKLCLQQWSFTELGSQNEENKQSKEEKTCPLCRKEICKIKMENDVNKLKQLRNGIPTTIYQQIIDENESRFQRKYLVNQYLREREQKRENEQNNSQNGIMSSHATQVQAAGY